MCGIAGCFDRSGGRLREATAAVQAMRHRGPDETGFWSGDGVHLGMCRLAIIAPEGNHQPASNEDGSVRVVFNGQIYNHPELKRELEGAGHRFASEGDSEVIVHAYEEWGLGFLERVNGMFGIAIYDGREEPTLILARDRVGIKPLYYWLDDGLVAFGSEVKAVLSFLDTVPGVDAAGMLSLLTFEYIHGPNTLFDGVRKLEPGHVMSVTRGRVETRRYWQMPTRTRAMTEASAVADLRRLMSQAVEARMISDVPLGAFLSGGIDSSIIVALMSQCSDRPVETFSVGFEDATYNETGYARMVAEMHGTKHHEIMLKVDWDEFMKPVELMLDDPIGDFSVFSTYLVSRAAREHVTVVLSGDGGDELFGGYDTYLADKAARYYGLLGSMVTKRLVPGLMSRVRPSRAKKGLVNRAKVFSAGASRAAELGHVRWMMFADERMRAGLLTEDFAATVGEMDPADHVRGIADGCGFDDPMARDMYVDASFYLPENILHKVDRTSMATSLETRVPMLDHGVVELAMSMPAGLRIRGFRRKDILKQAFGDLLPPAILKRGKEGFSTPMKHWLRGPLKGMMGDVLSETRLKRDGYFKAGAVEGMKRAHLAEEADHAHVLWSMMLFCMWVDRYQSVGRTARRAEVVGS